MTQYRETDFSETKNIGARFLVMQGTDWWVLFVLCLFVLNRNPEEPEFRLSGNPKSAIRQQERSRSTEFTTGSCPFKLVFTPE